MNRGLGLPWRAENALQKIDVERPRWAVSV